MRHNSRLGHVLAAVQLTFAMALLIGAGLLVHSFMNLTGIDPGFDPEGVLSFSLVVPGDSAAEWKLEAAETAATRLESDPRVTSAGFVDVTPLTPGVVLISAFFAPPGKTLREAIEETRTQSPDEVVQARIVSPGYLRALDARLVAGTWTSSRSRGPPCSSRARLRSITCRRGAPSASR